MRIFDCTLRDGANLVGHGFSVAFSQLVLEGLLRCGIDTIELGNAYGLGAYEERDCNYSATDEAYLQMASRYAHRGELGMYLLAELAAEDRIRAAADAGLHFLRIGADAGCGRTAVSGIKTIKKSGMACWYSMRKCYLMSPEETQAEARMLEDAGADAITLMDSAGTMLPEEVHKQISILTESLRIPVGFHGHNNLGLAAANTLAAEAAGASVLDSCLLGIGRSAGNCPTELLSSFLLRQGIIEEKQLLMLLEFIEKELLPQTEALGIHGTVDPVALCYGISGIHSSFGSAIHAAAKLYQVSEYALILRLSHKGRRCPTEAIIETAAAELSVQMKTGY